MFKDAFTRERQRWDQDIRNKAADLIRRGVEPWEAMSEAKDIIIAERKAERTV